MKPREQLRDDGCVQDPLAPLGLVVPSRLDRNNLRGNKCDPVNPLVDEVFYAPGGTLEPIVPDRNTPPPLPVENPEVIRACTEPGQVENSVTVPAGAIVEFFDWRTIPNLDEGRLAYLAGLTVPERANILTWAAEEYEDVEEDIRTLYKLKTVQAVYLWSTVRALMERVDDLAVLTAEGSLVCVWGNEYQLISCLDAGNGGEGIQEVLANTVTSEESQAAADAMAVLLGQSLIECTFYNTEVLASCEDLGFAEPVPGDESEASRPYGQVGSYTVLPGVFSVDGGYGEDLVEQATQMAREFALSQLQCFYVNSEYVNSCDTLNPRGVRVSAAGTDAVNGYYDVTGDGYEKDGYSLVNKGNFVEFDGVADYAEVPSSAEMNIAGVTRVLRVVFRSPSVQPASNQALVSRGGWYSGWGLIYQSNNRVVFLAKQAANSTSNYYLCTLNVPLSLGTWYTVEISIDNAGVTSATVNGTPVSLLVSADRVGTYGDAGVPLQLARSVNLVSPTWHFNGSLAYVRMSDATDNTVFEYSMSESVGSMTGTPLVDLGPLGLNGTYYGGIGVPDSPVSRWLLRNIAGQTLYLSDTDVPSVLDAEWTEIYGDAPSPLVTDAGTEGTDEADPETSTPGQLVTVPEGFVESLVSSEDANGKAEALGLSLLDCYWVNEEYTATCQPVEITSGDVVTPNQEQSEAFGGPLAYTNTVDRGVFVSRESKEDAQEQAEVYADAQLFCIYCNNTVDAKCTVDLDGMPSLDKTLEIAAGTYCSPDPEAAQNTAETLGAIPLVNTADNDNCRYGNRAIAGSCFAEGLVTGYSTTHVFTATFVKVKTGDAVVFTSADGGGVVIGVTYYAVNAGTGGFQLSITPGGDPIELSENMSGSIQFPRPVGYDGVVADNQGDEFSYRSTWGSTIVAPNTFVVPADSTGGFLNAQEYADALAQEFVLLQLDCFWENDRQTRYCGADSNARPAFGGVQNGGTSSCTNGIAGEEGSWISAKSTGSCENPAVIRAGTFESRVSKAEANGLAAALVVTLLDCFYGNDAATMDCEDVTDMPIDPATGDPDPYEAPNASPNITVVTYADTFLSYAGKTYANQIRDDGAAAILKCQWKNEKQTVSETHIKVACGGWDGAKADLAASMTNEDNLPGMDEGVLFGRRGKRELNRMASMFAEASLVCDWKNVIEGAHGSIMYYDADADGTPPDPGWRHLAAPGGGDYDPFLRYSLSENRPIWSYGEQCP